MTILALVAQVANECPLLGSGCTRPGFGVLEITSWLNVRECADINAGNRYVS